MTTSVRSTGSDEDRTRFFRLSLVIIEELTQILRDLLHNEVVPTQIFRKVIKINHLHKTLRKDQIAIVSDANTRGYKDFDITLLYTLLRNVCQNNIPPPSQNWGVSKMPAQNEITVGDDIERIRLIRNKLFGHISEAAISETEYKEYWSIISDICTRLKPLLNKDYVRRLQDAEERSIDADTENKYTEFIRMLIMKDEPSRDLNSKEIIEIEPRVADRRPQLVQTFINTSISILNEMVGAVHAMSPESDIQQIYESLIEFIRDNKEEPESLHLQNLFKTLTEKIKSYAKLQGPKRMKILANFIKFSLKMKKEYGAQMECFRSSILLLATFSSRMGFDLYKKDLENGRIGEQILELLLYPPFLESFGLKADDIAISLNGSLLTQYKAEMESSSDRPMPRLGRIGLKMFRKIKKKLTTEKKKAEQGVMPSLPTTPIPNRDHSETEQMRIRNNTASAIDLPLQRSVNKRMEDLAEDDYGYTTSKDVCRPREDEERSVEEMFMDARRCAPYYQDLSCNVMINKSFFSPKGRYEGLTIADICQEIDTKEDQQDVWKFIVTHLIPDLKTDCNIHDTFSLLCCKNKNVKSLCIYELTEMLLTIDPRVRSCDDLKIIYELDTIQLMSVITDTKKTSPLFQPLISLGIVFNCFIYLKAIEAKSDWIEWIHDVESRIQSKMKQTMERKDPDVQIYVKTVKCVLDLRDVHMDNSILYGEDLNDILPECREDTDIYIEGLAYLYHTGNLVLRQKLKFQTGVHRLVKMVSFMNASDDGKAKWFHCLLGQYVLRILQQEHNDVKSTVCEQCEDDLLSILMNDVFHHEVFSLTQSLFFHHKERVRSRYRDIAKKKGKIFSKVITENHIRTLLNRHGLDFEGTSSEVMMNDKVGRKQCLLCKQCASITCFYEAIPEELTDVNLYNNIKTVKQLESRNSERNNDIQNELEALKQIESEEFHENVARLLAFNPSFPKFYIKEKIHGDNLQRRLLEAREQNKIIPIVDLIGIIIQAVEGVIYVHNRGCLLRDITSASFGCNWKETGYEVKLKNFEKAAKPSDFSDGGIINGLHDLNFQGVPVRWAAPESLLQGHYSIYSDVWSFNILADEILNYAAWPYSDIIDADINDLVVYIVFTHLKPQGFNRPRRVQGLILEGLSTVPEQRLKLEALRERLQDILDTFGGGKGCNIYDTYSGVEGCRTTQYEIPHLTERQIKAKSIFERGIPSSIQSYRESGEDPYALFATEVASHESTLKKQTTTKDQIHSCILSSNNNYEIQSEDKSDKIMVVEGVTNDFVKYTYNRLEELSGTMNSIEPWPPEKRPSADGYQLHYKFPGTMHLLDIVLHKELGKTIVPYIELLYELANHVDTFHSAGWILRCLRAKHVWINTTKEQLQFMIPKVGKYRNIGSSEMDIHLEQIKVDDQEYQEDVQWLPIEVIKANLYSKESDVYAFGMVTWEVMTAFGQEGVIYHGDEETESLCIPFNYQQSENILSHLVKGYIPEKPLKCPDWFYQEITRPCLLHQKIDRPSMKTILNILQASLNKTLPKQILQHPQEKPDDYEGCEPWPEPETYSICDGFDDDFVPQSQQRPVSEYEHWYNGDVLHLKIDQLFTEESKGQNADNTKSPIPQKCQYPDFENVYDVAYSYYDKNDEKQSSRLLMPIPAPIPNLQKRNNQIAMTSVAPDSWVPPVPLNKKGTLECIDDQNNAPSILRRPTSEGFLDVSESSIPRSNYVPILLPELANNVSMVEYVNVEYTCKSDLTPIRSSSQMKDAYKGSDFVKFNTVNSERGFESGCVSTESNKKRETPVYVNVRDIRELDTEPPPLPPRNY